MELLLQSVILLLHLWNYASADREIVGTVLIEIPERVLPHRIYKNQEVRSRLIIVHIPL